MSFFSCHLYSWGFWFRVCGYGLSFQLGQEPMFSERYGYSKGVRFGPLRIAVVTP